MKKIKKEAFDKAAKYFKEEARPIEKAVFEFYFESGDKNNLLKELKGFQNADGGFAGYFEPDSRLPLSTPMATSMALRLIHELKLDDIASEMKDKIFQYLDNSYNEERKGWFSVIKEINDFPHAPWWDFDTDTNMTVIDHYWGNPSAEIIGYIYNDEKYNGKLDKNALLKNTVDYWNVKEEYKSEHEIMCFIRLYNILPKEEKNKIEYGIKKGISGLLNMNIAEWGTYVPRPLDFIYENNGEFFGITLNQIDMHLYFVVDEMNQHGLISPNWQWGVYPESWEIAKKEWTGVKTLEFLIIADKFNRIEK